MKNSIIRIIVLESDKSLHTVYKNHFDEIADYELVGSYTSANEALKDFDVIKNAFKKGANGYLTKPLTLDKLEHALRSMEKEGAAMSNDIVKKIIHNFHKKTFAFFSERENQIVDYLCQGATYKMIAQKLFVTTSAVNFHIQNIYLKLDVNSKSEALSKLEQLQDQLEEY